MRHLPLFMCTAFCGLYSSQTEAADKKNERPNILWLTFEDTSAMNLVAMAMAMYIRLMQTAWQLVAYNL